MAHLINRRDFIRVSLFAAVAGSWTYLCPERAEAGSAPVTKGNELEGAGNAGEPGYLKLHREGGLRERGEKLWNIMAECRLCPRECLADRISGERGFCGADSGLVISSAHPHFGEERPLAGSGGSGTIFFSHCSLRCVFCINWQISHRGDGTERSIPELADMMLALQDRGCHNINVVTPTHYLPHIILALDRAAGTGLKLPLVYNTCGYERMEILKELDGIVDIYLPDFKYFSPETASRYSAGARRYPEIARAALIEMNRQVGTAHPDEEGLITRGLMIRHLVMPNDAGGSAMVMKWIARNLPADTYVNIMSQYRPVYRAGKYPKISRTITSEEYLEVIKAAREAGLVNLDIQG